MSGPTSYRAPTGRTSAELREKGSRFLAELVPAADEAAAREALADVAGRHAGATHHCWALRVGAPALERSADDGEPSGTAGAPILRSLQGAEVSDAILVVTRWYGGVKLGRGGLVRAYGGAAAACLATASLVERRPTRGYRLELPYEVSGPLKRILAARDLTVVSRSFAERIRVEVQVSLDAASDFEAAVADLGRGVRIERINSSRSP